MSSFETPRSRSAVDAVMRTLEDPSLPPTRREALIRIIGNALLAGAALVYPDDVHAQLRNRVGATTPANPGKRILTPRDLTFKGWYRLPSMSIDGVGTTRQKPAWASRVVDGKRRWFALGSLISASRNAREPLGSVCVVELEQPDGDPDAVMDKAPRLSLVKNYGQIWKGRDREGNSIGPPLSLDGIDTRAPSGLWWDEQRQGLWFSWTHDYAGVKHHADCGFVPIAGTKAGPANGSWRPTLNPKRCALGWMALPEWFWPHVGGKRVARYMWQRSGNAASTFGCNLSPIAVHALDPFTAPSDVGSSRQSLAVQSLIMHDVDTPQKTRIPYRNCQWPGGSHPRQSSKGASYICSYSEPWVPNKGGPNPNVGRGRNGTDTAWLPDAFSAPSRDWRTSLTANAEANQVRTAVWIDTPTLHGVLFLGWLGGNPPGYEAPGDPEGLCHLWYGDPAHATSRNDGTSPEQYGYRNRHCCHGQLSAWWIATGPAAHRLTTTGWIYNPDDLVLSAKGLIAPHKLTPSTDEFYVRSTILPQMQEVKGNRQSTSGAVFEPATRRLFVPIMDEDNNKSRCVIAVFDVAR